MDAVRHTGIPSFLVEKLGVAAPNDVVDSIAEDSDGHDIG